MKLIVAEKPSVAATIAQVIGADQKEQGYISGNDYYITWCVGHLITSAKPEQYDPKYKKWAIEQLPIIPDDWKMEIVEGTAAQYKIVSNLLNAPEVDEIIEATDAGREGELIFRLVYNKSGCKKPFKRLWINTLVDKDILQGLQTLQDGTTFDNLYFAALARLKADWIIGMNATRLYSCLYDKTLNVGRVQSPTINLIVTRQNEITNFVPKPYFILSADCKTFKAYTRTEAAAEAQEIIDRCAGKIGTVTELQQEEKRDTPPMLYDLTGLQIDANKLLGYSANQTLEIAQSLYEQKLISYPRTDSKHLTQNMAEQLQQTIQDILISPAVDNTLAEKFKMGDDYPKRLLNDDKVSDHHALLPTGFKEQLPETEKNILSLISYRVLAAVALPCSYQQTNLTLEIEGTAFKASGRSVTEAGFKGIKQNMTGYLKGATEDEANEDTPNDKIPPELQLGDTFNNIPVTSTQKKTTPPKPYTDATLLADMEHISRHIDDQQLKEASKKGLGTPATRAGILEKIISSGFIDRKGKQLIPTKEAIALMEILPNKLKSPQLTAEWELQLEQINKGTLDINSFLDSLAGYMNEIIEAEKKIEHRETSAFKPDKEVIGTCPRCGRPVYEGGKSFYCSGYKAEENPCSFAIWKADKFFTEKGAKIDKRMAAALLSKGKAKAKNLLSKKGTKYDATIILVDTGKYVNFKLEFDTLKK